MKRPCPNCGHPAVTVFKLLSLGGLRRAMCENCGAAVGLSPLSSFVLMSIGTWLPIAGAIIGARLTMDRFPGSVFVGGALGLAVSWALFAIIYFRRARLIVT